MEPQNALLFTHKVNICWCHSQLFDGINGDIQRLHTLNIKGIESRLRYAAPEFRLFFQSSVTLTCHPNLLNLLSKNKVVRFS